jgi:hypothetical protein
MHFIYLEDYKKHPEAKINPTLLWEYDLADFDYQQMRNIIVQRVIERGWPRDWWAALNMYGENGMKEAIKSLPYLNDKDINFVSKAFKIPLLEMMCSEKKKSRRSNYRIKIELIPEFYDSVEVIKAVEGTRKTAIENIAAMMLDAVSASGENPKQFIDIALLSGLISAKQMMNGYERRHSSRNPVNVLKALLYHHDVNFDEPVETTCKTLSWKAVEKRLLGICKSPNLIFDESPFA